MSNVSMESGLRECGLFSALNGEDLKAVAGFAAERVYEPGSTVFGEGDKAHEILILKEGRIALQMTLPAPAGQLGRRITVDIVGEKEAFGWSALVEPYRYTMTAVCLQKAAVLAIDGEKLKALLQQKPETGYQVFKGLISVVASRLQDTRHVLVSERLLAAGRQEAPVRTRVSGT